MSTHDKIATRLAIILNKLNQGERFSIDELVEEFNVTKRTIYRDLNERLSYLPIKRENNLYFLESYYLGKLNFNDMQNFATFSGIKKLYPSLEEKFLKNILDTTIEKTYIVKGYNYEDISNKTNEFYLLENAIQQCGIIKFSYKNKIRIVKPYKLLNTKGIWYLIATENDTLKTFSIQKIINIKSTNQNFTPDKEIIQQVENENNTWFNKELIEVILKVNHNVAEYFQRRKIMPHQVITKELENNDILVSTKVSFDEEILKLVRYWIPYVRIMSPLHLQGKLELQLIEYLKSK